MKTLNTSAPSKPAVINLFASGLLLLLLSSMTAFAGSAAWKLNPTNGDWNTAANWSPSIVPDGTADIATFQSSSTTNVFISKYTEVNAITFNPGASAFTISASPGVVFTVSGTGITNDAGTTQNFLATAASGNDIPGTGGGIEFFNSASAGSQCVFTI